MSEYQYELDLLNAAVSRHGQTIAALESIEANILSKGRASLQDMQSLSRILPGHALPVSTSVAGLCSQDAQLTAALEAINWKKAGLLGLIAAIIGAIIALIARIRGNSKNVITAVEKAAQIPNQVGTLQKKIEKDIRQVQAQDAKSDDSVQVIEPTNANVEDGYGGYITQVEYERRKREWDAQQKRKNEVAKANRDDYSSMRGTVPLSFDMDKLKGTKKSAVDETKMAKLAKQFEQRFPIYGKVTAADMSKMLGISDAQLSGAEPFKLDAVLSGLMDNVDQFMVDRITAEKAPPALSARRRMIYVVAVISGAKKNKNWTDVFWMDDKIAQLEGIGASVLNYQDYLLKASAADTNQHFEGIDMYGGASRSLWWDFSGNFNESRSQFAEPRRVPVEALKGWARIVSTVTTVDSVEEMQRDPEMNRIIENSNYPKMGLNYGTYALTIKQRKSMVALSNSEKGNQRVNRDTLHEWDMPILDYVRDDEASLKRRATEVLGNSFSLTEFKLKVDAMQDNAEMLDIVGFINNASKRLDSSINRSLTVGADGKLKNLDNDLFKVAFRSSHEEVSAILRGKAFDFNDPANAEATAAVMKIHHSINDAPSRMIMGLSKSIARYSEFLNVMANYKTLLSSEYLAMVDFFRSELMKK